MNNYKKCVHCHPIRSKTDQKLLGKTHYCDYRQKTDTFSLWWCDNCLSFESKKEVKDGKRNE